MLVKQFSPLAHTKSTKGTVHFGASNVLWFCHKISYVPFVRHKADNLLFVFSHHLMKLNYKLSLSANSHTELKQVLKEYYCGWD